MRIDFESRQDWLLRWQSEYIQALNENRVFDFAQVGSRPDAGQLKAAMTTIGLKLRRDNPDLVIDGAYLPLYATGPIAEHLVAFARVRNGRVLLTAGLRWMADLLAELPYPQAAESWHETVLPIPEEMAGRNIVNVLTNERWTCAGSIPLRALFGRLPGALITLA
ncbi:MAG: hypothetical protein QM757_08805 [Paludibaculum sp.]